jgi:Protein of unknown function (DUF3180)
VTESRTPPRGQEPASPKVPEPRLHPTSVATLVVLGLGSAAVAWILVANTYGDLPAIPWLPAFTLFALAAFEAFLARNTKARIDRKPNTEPVNVLAVARYVVLAKASSPAGAIFSGLYAGILVWLLVVKGAQNTAASNDLPPTATGLVASLALVGAALWLERSCRVPKAPEDDKPAE